MYLVNKSRESLIEIIAYTAGQTIFYLPVQQNCQYLLLMG